MKYYSKLKQYKCSNLIYDETTKQAHSYEWYIIAKEFNGLMVLNTYSYSPTTLRHAYKLRNLFDDLSIEYVKIHAPRGLQNLDAAIDLYQSKINELTTKINNPRCHKLKYERTQERETLIKEMGFIQSLTFNKAA